MPRLAAARGQKADAEAKARIIRDALKRGAPVEILRHHQFRAVAPAGRAAGDLAGAACRAVRRRCLPSIRASRNCARRSPISIGRCGRGRAARAIASRTTPGSRASRLESLSASLDQLKKQAASSNEQDVQLRALERDAKSQRDLLESYLAKYREATARDSIGAVVARMRASSRAAIVSNTPSWPKKLPTVLIAALGMFTLAVGFMLTGQLMNGACRLRPWRLPCLSAPAAAAACRQLQPPREYSGRRRRQRNAVAAVCVARHRRPPIR